MSEQEDALYKSKETIEEEENVSQEYEEVKTQYDEFETEYENIKEMYKETMELNDDEKIDLKKLYKKAARLCHPDLVNEEFKEKALQLIQELNEAYDKKNLSRVKQILHSLENGTSFEVSSDSINDINLLKEKIAEYKKKIEEIKEELDEIEKEEAFQTISTINNWDDYFENLKGKLQNEKEKLEQKLSQVDYSDGSMG